MWPLSIAQVRNARLAGRWPAGQVACQVSRSAWVRRAGWPPRSWTQVRNVAGGGEPLLGVLAGGGPQRPAGGAGAHPGELVPDAELAEQLLVGVAVQVVEAAAQPAVVVQELPVGGGEQAAVHEQVTQVDGGAPVWAGGECLMGQGQAAGGQVGEQGSDVRRAQPVQGGGRVGAGVQGTGQRREPGRGLVAEEPAARSAILHRAHSRPRR